MWHYTKKLASILLASLALMALLPGKAEAADIPPVKLVLSGSGATPWNIGNIKPGDSGTKTVTLNNEGSQPGMVTIWISDIVSLQGTNTEAEAGNTAEPGDLDQYLLFNISAQGARVNVPVPTTLHNFPNSSSDTRRVLLELLPAGGSVDLTWEWQLPLETPNDAQGDILSFSINYMLEERFLGVGTRGGGGGGKPVGAGVSAPASLQIAGPGTETSLQVQASGGMAESSTVVMLENKVAVNFTSGTEVLSDGAPIVSGAPIRLELTVLELVPPPPVGFAIVGDAYDLSIYRETRLESITFSSPMRLIFNYAPEQLPEDVVSVSIAYYDKERGWVRLNPPPGFIAAEGQAVAVVDHLTLFAVLAELPSETQPAVPKPPAQGRFQVRTLEIYPDRIRVGESITIKSTVTNTGAGRSDYVLAAIVTGQKDMSQVVNLAPGESREVSFTFTPDTPGIYRVRVGDLVTSFTVSSLTEPAPTTRPTALPSPPAEGRPGIYSWLTLIIMGILLMLSATALLLIYRGRRSGSGGA